jgi:hypothetical protein
MKPEKELTLEEYLRQRDAFLKQKGCVEVEEVPMTDNDEIALFTIGDLFRVDKLFRAWIKLSLSTYATIVASRQREAMITLSELMQLTIDSCRAAANEEARKGGLPV